MTADALAYWAGTPWWYTCSNCSAGRCGLPDEGGAACPHRCGGTLTKSHRLPPIGSRAKKNHRPGYWPGKDR